jgi:ribosomal protein S18 acetylase RimI-like enzyme
MQASGGIYEFSEYKMVLQEALKPARAGAEVDLRPAQPEDLEVIARLNEICFGLPVESTRAWLENRLVNSNRQIMVAWVAGKRIGKIEILRAKTETSISAFCLFSEYRGQGYGTTILSRTVEQLVAEGCPQISLEVAVDNKHALLLYERCGFETETAYDYYRLPVGD